MKFKLEQNDIESIAQDVATLIAPLLRKKKDLDELFDVQGLAAYLKTSTNRGM
jgi:hypothetical protein